MHTSEVARLLSSQGAVPAWGWPPPSEAEAWETIQERRRRYENDPAALWPYRTDLHVVRENAKATQERFKDYTPIPLARDIAQYSSQLLFSPAAEADPRG
jgi:hypothetical protein